IRRVAWRALTKPTRRTLLTVATPPFATGGCSTATRFRLVFGRWPLARTTYEAHIPLTISLNPSRRRRTRRYNVRYRRPRHNNRDRHSASGAKPNRPIHPIIDQKTSEDEIQSRLRFDGGPLQLRRHRKAGR